MEGGGGQPAVVVARCGPIRIGVPVHAVRKVVAAPLPVPLPDAPASVAGLVNLHGTPLVVLDLARRGAAARDSIALGGRIVIVETALRRCGLLCEAVEGTLDLPEAAWQSVEDLVPGARHVVAGTAGDADLVVLRDPDTWLSDAEAHDLAAALARLEEGRGARTAQGQDPTGQGLTGQDQTSQDQTGQDPAGRDTARQEPSAAPEGPAAPDGGRPS